VTWIGVGYLEHNPAKRRTVREKAPTITLGLSFPLIRLVLKRSFSNDADVHGTPSLSDPPTKLVADCCESGHVVVRSTHIGMECLGHRSITSVDELHDEFATLIVLGLLCCHSSFYLS
jgi:hypothetical protein